MKYQISFLESKTANLSARQANQTILLAWRQLAKARKNLLVSKITIQRGAQDLHGHLPQLMGAHRIVVSSLDENLIQCVAYLRAILGICIPFQIHLHGTAHSGPTFLRGIVPHLQAHDVFVVSSQSEAEVLQLFLSRANLIRIPFLYACSQTKARPQGETGSVRFLYVGRLSLQKNVHILLRAFSNLKKRNPETHFEFIVFGGEDAIGAPEYGIRSLDYGKKLQKIAQNLNLTEVRWMGPADQKTIDRFIRSKRHIFVSASTHLGENFGLAAFRSLSLGHPAVLTGWGGHRDLKGYFPQNVQLVPVSIRGNRPHLKTLDLTRCMEIAMENKSRSPSRQLEKLTRDVSKSLQRSLTLRSNASPLVPTSYYRRLQKRLGSRQRGDGLFGAKNGKMALPLLRIMAKA